MLGGLNGLDVGRLRMSVGYGTHKKGRPLSPVEVGGLLRRAQNAGVSLQDCAKVVGLTEGQISRFLRVFDLPEDLRHLVDWGRNSSSIGFTTAVQLARVNNQHEQRALATAILERKLQTDEVRQVVQLRQRSGEGMEGCLTAVLAMRPTVDRRYVFVGAVGDQVVEAILAEMTQAERDSILRSALAGLGLEGTAGRLGESLITLVGDARMNSKLVGIGKEVVEARLRAYITAEVADS